MTSRRRIGLLSMYVLGAAGLRSSEPPAGFAPLFNGKDLTGWRGGAAHDHRKLLEMTMAERTENIAGWTTELTKTSEKTGRPHWRVEGAVLVNDGFATFATTDRDYGDFELLVDYKISPHASSGICLRGVPQVQILDHTEAQSDGKGFARGSGGLGNNRAGSPGEVPLTFADRPAGEWNQFRILLVGSRVSVWLNGKLVVNHAILENHYDRELPREKQRPIPARGPIQLQPRGGETQWRNFFLREIGSNEACDTLARHGDDGFQPIFNGKNLDGWAGDIKSVEVSDGILRWRVGERGTLYWNRELADFQSRIYFAVSPGGNNGLAIRYSGHGIPAYDGMCEIQLRDDYATPSDKDPRQADGSVYGMIAATRGYQHAVGEWNFQEVTVKGSRITVELNGTIILDGDVNQVAPHTVVANRPHPGKDRTRGFFGFTGHSDPFQFKGISIKQW